MKKQISQAKKDDIEKENDLMNYSMFESRVKFLQGKVLTIVDASYQEKEQRDAVKSLVNNVFSQQLTEVYDWTHPNIQSLSEADMRLIFLLHLKEQSTR